MKKTLFFIAVMAITCNLFAGGLVTNTNQSAMFTRLQNRNASTGIDAVYFNPAGVTKLGEGFFLSVNNQTISQTKTVLTNFSYLNGTPREYVGDVSAPVYPGIYAAYNTGNISLSAGFNPIGGGGGAKYKTGLPSFESEVAPTPAKLTKQGISTNKYSADIFFEGTSIYFGYQLNAAYKINEQISVGAGIRMVSAKNTYNGSIRNIQINPNQPGFGAKYNGVNMNSATGFFSDGNAALTQLATGSTAMATGLTTALANVPGLTGTSSVTDVLTPAQIEQFAMMLGAAGQNPAVASLMDIQTAIGTLGALASGFTANAQIMATNAAKTQDIYADVEETGTGYAPILSVNYSPSDKFNFSLRYEFKTKLELKTTVFDNKGAGIFVNGEKIVADMPALLAIGAEVRPIDKLSIAATFNTFFDKDVDYSGRNTTGDKMIKNNYLEYGLGVEYSITDKLRASAGWLGTKTGILPAYQNDQRFSTNSNSFGFGAGYRISPLIDFNLGCQYSVNAKYDKICTYTDKDGILPSSTYIETYSKKTMIFAFGFDFYFGKK